MSTTYFVGSGLDATSNPDPNTLTTVSPFDGSGNVISDTWETQGSKAFFPRPRHSLEKFDDKVYFDIIPSGGDAVTYDVTLWFFNKKSESWYKPATNNTESYTGSIHDYVELDEDTPFFLQFSNISAGTLSLYISPKKIQIL